MATAIDTIRRLSGAIHRHRGLILPALAAAMIFVILVPLPPFAMDILLASSLALAAIILLTVIHVDSPLEFSVFPTVLLGATLFRLVLNVATTRLVLTAGAEGRSVVEAQHAAGHVVWAFSQFVTAGSLTVGVILFAIIAVVQFVVVTKGAARISEVTARFVLDAMPGKQMAIDSDLQSKLIDEQQARRRRDRISREADFYGAMDGASKFIRGDAVACVLITFVNILGGLYVGMVQYHWDWSATVDLFTRLTIGDGLVAQVPALIVSLSAALLVTRSAEKTHLGEEVIRQLVSRPVVLVAAAAFLAALSLTSLPKAPLLLLGGGFVGLAWLLTRRRKQAARETAIIQADPVRPAKPQEARELQDLLNVDPMRVELGYALVEMVESPDGDLLGRVAALRRQIATELGLVVPPIRIRDDMRLSAHAYVIRLRNTRVAGDKVYPRQLLAVGGPGTTGSLAGKPTQEPAFGTPAVWISPDQRQHADMMNYTVVDAPSVLVTHLGEVIRRHAGELLTRQQVARMLDRMRIDSPSLVEEITAGMKASQIQKVLQNLLAERVPVHDLETILEAMAEYTGDAGDAQQLTEHVRSALSRCLSQQYCGQDGRLWCVSLDSELESEITTHLEGPTTAVPPELARQVVEAAADSLGRLRLQGRTPVLLCDARVRPAMRRLIAAAVPGAAVLGYNEITSVEIESVATVRTQS